MKNIVFGILAASVVFLGCQPQSSAPPVETKTSSSPSINDVSIKTTVETQSTESTLEQETTQVSDLVKATRSRDAMRKADLNNIIAAVEAYYADHSQFPSGKICLTKGSVLSSYFQNGTPPSDPQGLNAPRLADCAPGQYLYCEQKDLSLGYYVAAIMELENDGNVKRTAAHLVTPICGANSTLPDISIPPNAPTDGDSAYVVVK